MSKRSRRKQSRYKYNLSWIIRGDTFILRYKCYPLLYLNRLQIFHNDNLKSFWKMTICSVPILTMYKLQPKSFLSVDLSKQPPSSIRRQIEIYIIENFVSQNIIINDN